MHADINTKKLPLYIETELSAVPLFLAYCPPCASTIMLLYDNGYAPQQPTLLQISVLYSKGHFIHTSCKHLFSLEMLSLKIQYILLSFFIVFPTNLVGYIFYSLYYNNIKNATVFLKFFPRVF